MGIWGKSGSRATTWPPGADVRRRPAWGGWNTAAALGDALRHRLAGWIQAETAPGRLFPWLPVAFGAGITVYFAAAAEPVWWAGLVLLIPLAVLCIGLRSRPIGFPVLLACAAVAAGFLTATWRAVHVAHPVLSHVASNVALSGFVEARERRERSDRIVLRVHHLEGGRLRDKPERVRLSLRKGTAPAVGAFVSLKARLSPPLQALRPGGYDFARDLYFQRIGATGFVLGTIKVTPPADAQGWKLRYLSAVSGMRGVIDARIRAVLGGDEAAIASALLTGTRDAISAPVNDAMYVSGLGHVLSISGYHMAVVATVIFFFVRGLLALIPFCANHYPIKKWAAFAALLASAFYLLLSGAEVATQRSFIMTAIVLLGIVCDRPALTLRTIALAAFAVLLLQPESIVHPSFQMSFAATLALVAGFQHSLRWFSAGADTPWKARVALWGGREIVGLLAVSLLAGCATMLYSAYHFHRLAPYGLIANLAAMPLVSFWIMPVGLLAIVAIPFGFDGPLWRLMGLGIEGMTAVAAWVATLPGAVGRVTAFGIGPVIIGTLGLILVCLLRTPLRWSGAVLLVFAAFAAWRTPLPDILVAPDGQAVAVRNAQGRLNVMKAGRDDFVIREWLGADADLRTSHDASLDDDVRCDGIGCVTRLADGRVVALSLSPAAIAEDCRRAAVVVSPRDIPMDCDATAVSRALLRAAGAITLYRSGNGFDLLRSRLPEQDRPWSPREINNGEPPAPSTASRPAADATPRLEDLDYGDRSQ